MSQTKKPVVYERLTPKIPNDEEVKKEINDTEVPSIENTKKSIDLNELEVSNNDINPNRNSRF
jgi:hypothetical protein